MNEVSLKPVIEELENLFSKFNTRFFDGGLEKPVITVSPDHTRGAYGWCTGWKAWKAGEDEGHYEINLCAEYLNRPFEETCGTLIHEMVHLQNLQDGVQDTSRSGTYHNKKFKETAEAHGLTVEKGEKYGWHKTTLSPEALEFVQSLGKQGFTLVRPRPLGLKGSSKGGSSSRKYVCPCCGAIIRATKEVRVICADCLKYCYDHGFDWGGLYEIFHRVSCWCCPLQSLDELRKLRKHFTDLWAKLLDMEHQTWRNFRADYSVDQLEIRFSYEDERLATGLPINRTREFMSELRKRLEEAGFPQNK